MGATIIMVRGRAIGRAPKGGLEYAGKRYRGGQFCPVAAVVPPISGGAPEPIRIVVTSQYGVLSRGRHSARQGNGHSATWAEKDAHGRIVITEPGQWRLHCSDGFRRVARAVLQVDKDGSWKMTGETWRFDVIED